MSHLHAYGSIKDVHSILPPVPEDVNPDSSGWWQGHFIVVEQIDDKLVLQSTNYEIGYRTVAVLENNFEEMGHPKYLTNDKVRIPRKNKTGRIYSVTWHSKRNCFRYMVDYGDRKSTCWYFDEDLEKLDDCDKVNSTEAKS